MAHRYGEPVPVTLAPDGTPATFTWRGTRYTVVEVLGKWHLMDRWWERGDLEGAKSRDAWRHTRANRYYWRLEVQEHMIFEVFLDVARRPPLWVLDVVQD